MAFVEDDGYARRELWSDAGWKWREKNDADHPVSRLDHLDIEEIRQGVLERNRRLYSYPAIIARFFRSLWKTGSFLHSLLALFVNIFWVRRKNIARIGIINHLAQRREYSSSMHED